MRKMILLNVILLSLCVMFFILDFFVIEYMTKFFFYTPIIILFIEAGVFLFTFKEMKKSTLRVIRKVLGIYCILVIAFFVFIKIYTSSTGYIFIYFGYSSILIGFIIYPCILWGMIRLMTLESMINNRSIIASITVAFTIVIMALNGFIALLGGTSMEFVEKPDGENTIYVTESAFLHSYTREYTQKNILFMEYVDTVEYN